jgi:hypothetical protein
MSRNPIFEALVGTDDTDIEALTAYALYKKHKRQWARGIEAKTGSLPSQSENVAFFQAVGTPDQLERYRKDARDILLAFAEKMVDDARPNIEARAIEGRIEDASRKIEGYASFWTSVKSGVVSTLINTAVLILLAIGVRLLGIDLLTAYQSLGTAP